jgi:Disulphide bond corrector protein DsbC
LSLIVTFILMALAFVGYQVFRAYGTRTYPSGTKFTERAKLAEFTKNGVRVAFTLEADSRSQTLLRATFTPTEAGFHLYSKDLDPKSVGGIGVATRLELMPNSSIKVGGKVFADVAPRAHKAEGLKFAVPIYPDGPVTLRLPVDFVGTATNVSAQVAVSYMACKTDGVCLLPVERKIREVRIPR